jgi:hypothetical protein
MALNHAATARAGQLLASPRQRRLSPFVHCPGVPGHTPSRQAAPSRQEAPGPAAPPHCLNAYAGMAAPAATEYGNITIFHCRWHSGPCNHPAAGAWHCLHRPVYIADIWTTSLRAQYQNQRLGAEMCDGRDLDSRRCALCDVDRVAQLLPAWLPLTQRPQVSTEVSTCAIGIGRPCSALHSGRLRRSDASSWRRSPRQSVGGTCSAWGERRRRVRSCHRGRKWLGRQLRACGGSTSSACNMVSGFCCYGGSHFVTSG